MPDNPPLADVDSRAASDAKLAAVRKFCGNLKWFAHLLEQTWTHPTAPVPEVAPNADGEAVLAIPDAVQAWLETYCPHVTELRGRWEHPYPIADFSRAIRQH